MTEQAGSRKRRRIFIISIHAMFGHGLKKLLQQEPDIDVIGYETNTDHALEQVRQLQPDVIILDSDKASSDDSSTMLSRLLKENLGTTIISLTLQHNELFIYSGVQRLAKSTDDLMKAIRQGTPACSPTPFRG